MKKISIGIVGGRGHTGAELIALIAAHPQLELAFVSSRERSGERIADHVDRYVGDLRYEALEHVDVAERKAGVVVLALPNGKAAERVVAIDATSPQSLVVDLSADHRFDPAWFYSLPELNRDRAYGQRRISNPGCYATAMQLAISPLLGRLAGPPQCFGVSGYSGAGTTPSDRNDVAKLRDNLMAYSLVDHVHEREVSLHLGVPVEFMPHVAAHFRGITMTVNMWLQTPVTVEEVHDIFTRYYAGEPLITVIEDAPWVSQIAGCHGAQIGGFAVAPGGKRVVVVATLDNLLKGAATQAIQNINNALGFPELAGIAVNAPSQRSGGAS